MEPDIDSVYLVVGVIPAHPDGPTFATPIYKDTDGKQFYVQNLRTRRRVQGFQFVGDNLKSQAIISIHGSNTFHTRDQEAQVGFVDVDGRATVGTMSDIIEGLLHRCDDFSQHPFFYYHLSRYSKNRDMFVKAVQNEIVADTILKGWVKIPKGFGDIFTNRAEYHQRIIRAEIVRAYTNALDISTVAKNTNSDILTIKKILRSMDISLNDDRTTLGETENPKRAGWWSRRSVASTPDD